MEGRARLLLLLLFLAAPLAFGRAPAWAATATPPPSPTPDAEGRIIYEVQQGDTPLGIAARFDIDLQTLYEYNDLDDESIIRIGQRLVVGVAEEMLTLTPPPPPGIPEGVTVREDNAFIYRVEAGDTLGAIAFRYELSVQELLDLNDGLTADTLLQIGQEIIVGRRQQPASVGSSADLPSPATPTVVTTPPPSPTSLPTPTATFLPPPTAFAGEEGTAAPAVAEAPASATPESATPERSTGEAVLVLIGAVALLGVSGLAFILFARRA